MGLVAFDTHQFIQTLSQAGMPVAQAEAISNAVRMTYAHGASDLVTKTDLAVVRNGLAESAADLNEKMSALDDRVSALEVKFSELDRKVTALDEKVTALGHEVEAVKVQLQLLEKNMTIRLGTMMFVSVGIMMAFMKYLQG